MSRSVLSWIAIILVIVGAINWGLVGAFNGLDLVDKIFGSVSWLASTIYILVGLAGIWELVSLIKG